MVLAGGRWASRTRNGPWGQRGEAPGLAHRGGHAGARGTGRAESPFCLLGGWVWVVACMRGLCLVAARPLRGPSSNVEAICNATWCGSFPSPQCNSLSLSPTPTPTQTPRPHGLVQNVLFRCPRVLVGAFGDQVRRINDADAPVTWDPFRLVMMLIDSFLPNTTAPSSSLPRPPPYAAPPSSFLPRHNHHHRRRRRRLLVSSCRSRPSTIGSKSATAQAAAGCSVPPGSPKSCC